jgi:glycosyltransferase involved in cell wall biosynthesis
MLGYRPDVERLYRIFDIFTLNSFAEGMSNTLLEAMASGLPVVCTAVGGNVELISDHETGTLVASGQECALAEAIHKYMRSTSECRAHGMNARRFAVENFSIRNMIDQYAALYESVAI